MKNQESIKVETRLGTLVAKPCSDPDNKGIYIEFIPKGSSFAIDTTLVEVPEDKDCLSIYSYSDPSSDEWQYKVQINSEDIQ